jgi:subtilisin-like proprotein convertase family protein
MPSGNAATFRTWLGDSLSNHRVFPKMSTIVTDTSSSSEQLPTYTRDMTFRLMVRDNRPNGGGIGWADVAFHAFQGAGPFLVLTPNAPTALWNVGEYVNVTWDVSNTDKAPVNCQRVNIRLSTDGGFTYPITLASNVVNDGSQYVLVPDAVTTKARVRVEAADNVFFDISNTSFKIQQATQPTFSFGLSTDLEQVCLPAVLPIDVLSSGLQGFASPVALDVDGSLPVGTVATFTQNTITPGQPCTLSLDFSNVHEAGTYTFKVRGIVNGTTNDTIERSVTVTLFRNEFTGFALTKPIDGANGLGLSQFAHWATSVDALSYDFQVSKSPSFDSLVYFKNGIVNVDSAKIAVLLDKGTGYYWRIRPNNQCGSHDWTAPYFFSTYTQSCKVFTANDLPGVFSTNGMPTVQSQVTVNSGGTISDVNIKQIQGYHDAFGDLEAHLISPFGSDVILFKKKCGFSSSSFNFGLDDDAPTAFACPPPNNGGVKRPQNPLSVLNGQNSAGVWTLKVKDLNEGGGGSLDGFQIEFCATVALQPPVLINNNILYLTSGMNKGITPDLLQTDDPNNTHDQLIYTLVTVPKSGDLQKNYGGALKPGAQFTQADIDNGAIRYFDYGGPGVVDGFRFVVTDNEGGFIATPTFVISTVVVATQEPTDFSSHISLFPNPTRDGVWVALDRQAVADTRLTVFDASGRLVQTAVLPAGSDRLHLSTAGFSGGLYAVRMEYAGAVGVKRFVVSE